MKKLPQEIEIGIDELINDNDMSEAINEFLAKKYGFCTNSYCYGGSIVISNIDWDTTE